MVKLVKGFIWNYTLGRWSNTLNLIFKVGGSMAPLLTVMAPIVFIMA